MPKGGEKTVLKFLKKLAKSRPGVVLTPKGSNPERKNPKRRPAAKTSRSKKIKVSRTKSKKAKVLKQKVKRTKPKARRPKKPRAKKAAKKAKAALRKVKPAPKRVKKPVAKPQMPLPEMELVGEVTHYFPHVSAGVIDVAKPIALGDNLYIKGFTTDFKQKVTSMQINRVPIQVAKQGDEIGLSVDQRVRAGDKVYKI